MRAVPSSPVGAGPGEAAGPAGLGWAPAGPAGIDPSVRETVQVLELFAHDLGAADDAAQCGFVQYHPLAERPGRVVSPGLAAQPDLMAHGDLFSGA